MNIYHVYSVFSPIFRRKRMQRFLREIAPGPKTTILDVGGCPPTWEYIPGVNGRITILNVTPAPEPKFADRRYEFVAGDGTALPYSDKSFDVVFSNSVIEHVGDYEKQKAFAREASRVGRALWVQTPAPSFFIEPHFITPFIHWLPESWRKRLARRFTIWGLMTKPSPAEIDEFLSRIRLLSRRELAALFPDCEIIVERLFGWPKSYTAIRRS